MKLKMMIIRDNITQKTKVKWRRVEGAFWKMEQDDRRLWETKILAIHFKLYNVIELLSIENRLKK